jgi:hypothetical protein
MKTIEQQQIEELERILDGLRSGKICIDSMEQEQKLAEADVLHHPKYSAIVWVTERPRPITLTITYRALSGASNQKDGK